MDFQKACDSMAAMASVISVERLENGRRGLFRVVTGNKAYIDSIEHPLPGVMSAQNVKFVPNTSYDEYVPRDLNFEDYCYRAAIEKKCLHAYAHPDCMEVWFNMTFLPLCPDEGNLSYCMYIMEISREMNMREMSGIPQDLASAVLETSLKLRGTNDFRKTMREIIGDIRDLCEAEHCCILLMDQKTRSCSVLCEAFSRDTKLLSMEEYLDDSFYAIAESWENTVIAGSNCLIAKDAQDMEVVKQRNPVWHESITSAGGRNIILFPLRSQNDLIGYIWAINFNAEDSIRIKETLELTTFIMGSEIGSNLLINRLKFLSSRDMLTNVMNRNEMNLFVDQLADGEEQDRSVSVIFADLNGLKDVNDNEGHQAGDILIRNAAAALKELFEDTSIFRAGGDEFAVIVIGMEHNELDRRIRILREVAEKYDNLNFSIGSCFRASSRDIKTALRIADEHMYEDKKAYYKRFPEKIRSTSRDLINGIL